MKKYGGRLRHRFHFTLFYMISMHATSRTTHNQFYAILFKYLQATINFYSTRPDTLLLIMNAYSSLPNIRL